MRRYLFIYSSIHSILVSVYVDIYTSTQASIVKYSVYVRGYIIFYGLHTIYISRCMHLSNYIGIYSILVGVCIGIYLLTLASIV